MIAAIRPSYQLSGFWPMTCGSRLEFDIADCRSELFAMQTSFVFLCMLVVYTNDDDYEHDDHDKHDHDGPKRRRGDVAMRRRDGGTTGRRDDGTMGRWNDARITQK